MMVSEIAKSRVHRGSLLWRKDTRKIEAQDPVATLPGYGFKTMQYPNHQSKAHSAAGRQDETISVPFRLTHTMGIVKATRKR